MGRRVKMGSDYAVLKKILYILTGLTCAGMVIADAFTKPAEGGEILINIVLSFFFCLLVQYFTPAILLMVSVGCLGKRQIAALVFDILAVSMAAIMLSAGYFLSYLATIESPHFSYAFLGNGVILLLATVQMVFVIIAIRKQKVKPEI